jgi:hypothetical protein
MTTHTATVKNRYDQIPLLVMALSSVAYTQAASTHAFPWARYEEAHSCRPRLLQLTYFNSVSVQSERLNAKSKYKHLASCRRQ